MIPSRAELRIAAGVRDLVLLGVVSLDAEEAFTRYQSWIADGQHAGMTYLERYPEIRRQPASLLSGANCALVLALPYYQGDAFVTEDSPRPVARIAQYARFKDYHRTLTERAESLAAWLVDKAGGQTRVAVDTAPVLERALAESGEKGFIGKNTCYIHPKLGSFLLLGELFTTLALSPDAKRPSKARPKSPDGGCGECKLCQVNCPTGALDEAYRLDARKCLSYWTIENRGAIPYEFWKGVSEYVFGCDLCQLACPWNWKAHGNRLPESLVPREFPSLFETATMSQAEYERAFGGTPLTRAKRNGLRRNALIAMAILGDPRLPEALSAADRDPGEPVGETAAQIRSKFDNSITSST